MKVVYSGNVLRFDCLVLNKLAIGKAETNLVSALHTANLISCGTKEHTVCYCNCNMGVLSAFSIQHHVYFRELDQYTKYIEHERKKDKS